MVESSVRLGAADLDWLGFRRWIFISDQETLILDIAESVAIEFVMRESSRGTRVIEDAVRDMQEQILFR